MAGIYEKQAAIKIIFFKEGEERHDSPSSGCCGQAEDWLASAMKSYKSNAK